MENLFKKIKVTFLGILPYPYTAYPKCENAYRDYFCQLTYLIYDENDNLIDRLDFTEIVGNERQGLTSAQTKIDSKIYNLQKVFGNEKQINFTLKSSNNFFEMSCIGIFYNDTLIAITDENKDTCIDTLLNVVSNTEEFKRNFIETQKKSLLNERTSCQKRIEEINAELSIIS